MRLATLTASGMARFDDFLQSQRASPSGDSPLELLRDGSQVELIRDGPDTDTGRVFNTRYEFAEYAHALLGSEVQWAMSAEIWAWLTVVYFDQVCPIVGGVRKVRDTARYIPAIGNFRKLYRHLLLGPFHAYGAHIDDPERARVVLSGPLHTPGELAEQLMAGQERMTNRAVLEVAGQLYLDSASGKPKRGAGGKAAGSPRRFVDVLNQVDLTYDLYSLDSAHLLEKLPAEFDRFRASRA